LAAAGLPVVVVNPRQVHDFAKATGQLAKTDAIAAAVLAHFGEAIRPPVRPLPDATAQALQHWLARRRQLVEMLTAEQNRLPGAPGAVQAQIREHITWLRRQLHSVERTLKEQIQRSPVWREGEQLLRSAPGVGPVLAAVIVAEIGDIHRFARPEQLCSWAGLTPRHRESDTTVHRGRITKQGSKLLRWALIEAVQKAPADSPMRAVRERIEQRRGATVRNIGKTAAARKLLTLVFYGLRDGHIRALTHPAATG